MTQRKKPEPKSPPQREPERTASVPEVHQDSTVTLGGPPRPWTVRSPSDVLWLQQTIGNQDVARLLAEQGQNRPGSGQPLDPDTRDFMERRFGRDFSGVRVHTNVRATEAARAMNARAYTVGDDIAFESGQYAPETPEGAGLLAHELAHVVQQRGALPSLPGAGARFSTEHEEAGAERARHAIMTGQPVPSLASAPLGIACAKEPGRRPPVPRIIPTGQRAIIQWGDDQATVENAKALQTGRRSGANAAGASRLIHHRELVEGSLEQVRELEIVIHGETDLTATGTRILLEGENAPRARYGLVGLPKSVAGPALAVSPEEMAHTLTQAGFGKGRWARYRLRLVMCFGGVGKAESFASQLSARLASEGLDVETLGALGRVSAWPRRTEPLPRGEAISRSAAPAQKGVPQVEKYYEENPFSPLFRRPGTGWQRNRAPSAGRGPPPPSPQPSPPTETPRTGVAVESAEAGARPRSWRGSIGRVALGLAKFSVPLILEAIHRYTLAKEEAERAEALIEGAITSPEFHNRVDKLVEKDRLEIARRQYRQAQVYVLVRLRVDFINDVMERTRLTELKLGDVSENDFSSVVMGHDPLTSAEYKSWYVHLSLPLPPMELSRSEELKLQLEALGTPTNTPDLERERLLEDLRKAERAEETAKKEELARPRVLEDPKQRARQQSEIKEQLRRLNARKTPGPTKQEGAPDSPPGGPSLLPLPGEPSPSLLPGAPAPGEGSTQQAARVVKGAEAWALRLEQVGLMLEGRLGSDHSPTPKERQDFLDEVLHWQLAVKHSMNTFRDASKEEAVTGLSELLDRFGPTFGRIRTHLGGD